MYAKAIEQKADRIERVVAHSREKLARDEANEVESFIRRFCDRAASEDVLSLSVENLYGATLSLWKFAATRAPGEAKIRVYNPRIEEHGWKSPHTVVEVVNDDMPFLVDSVTSALNLDGYNVHLLFHPIFRFERDTAGLRRRLCGHDDEAAEAIDESVMHFQIDEQGDPAALIEIEQRIAAVLADVRASVLDWRSMLAKIDEALEELNAAPSPLQEGEIAEGKALLQWMANNHFTFLGYREYAYDSTKRQEPLLAIEGSGLGILRDPAKRVLRRGKSMGEISPDVQEFLRKPELVIVTKAVSRSTVHRPVHLDYVGIKRFGPEGTVVGERRFVGLFTSSAYNRTPREIPYLRRKLWRAMERSGLDPSSHDGKALLNILETYPRDELFQVSEEELTDTATGILGLEERPRIRLFVRRDKFERFNSCLVYVPRERYNTDIRRRFQNILTTAFNGRPSAFYTQVSESPLARIHFIVGTDPGEALDPDIGELEQRLVDAARSWDDDLHDALIERWGEDAGIRLWDKYGGAFPTAYKELFNAQMALFDIDKIEALAGGADVALNFYRRIEDGEEIARLKIYHPREAVALSDCLPMMEHMGLKVMEEHPYAIGAGPNAQLCWIQDFRMADPSGAALDFGKAKDKFEAAFARVWRGEMEDDGFNQLVLRAGLDWRQVVVLRAYCKYLRQTGIAFSQHYMEATLAANPEIARLLCALFATLFEPAAGDDRASRADALTEDIRAAFDGVASLDEDRILRRFLNLVRSTLRTNFYQPAEDGGPKPYLSLKLDSQQVQELPLPRPFREIFVYSPQVEGVHLRGGRVARGGLRWSDRREDFRTEVLGLMKAQMVKNAVIVPVGSKGGFVPKRLPVDGDRDAWLAEGIASYKTFIRGLLDLTDNLDGDRVVPPADVVRHDDDDPYLVVAADKGTASFSDIANEVAESYGYWLGDAFASGGKAGYDHKGMAITARGAWESVKRHFREIGHDVQSQDFTVIGCGDMSGDVFGNGMLLSRHIKLVAAFDHRDIFVDPNPDPAESWDERKRLFDLPRSSWADYDAALISAGGGVFERKAKSITLSPEMMRLFGVDQSEMTPNELIRCVLRAEADLLWFGGIGTYVKASEERHADAGDRANDGVRIDAAELRCKVVGEGANLGVTQRGRIEFALAGGRINTDFVDNSAGVDCSDHEVNIKVLLNAVVAEGEMTRKQRDRLLADMTDEVALLVLQDNYHQTLTLTVTAAQAVALNAPLARLMRNLERGGLLNREIEFLPDEEALAERQADGIPFSHPELSVLLAYAKIDLYQELLESPFPDDPYLAADLVKYFPRPLRKDFVETIGRHRLRREIIATHFSNLVVNRGGVTFVSDLKEESDADGPEIARALVIAREAFGLRAIWTGIQALDNKVPAATQTQMMVETEHLLRRASLWFLRHGPETLDIAALVDDFTPGIERLRDKLDDMLGELESKQLDGRMSGLVQRGVPRRLAHDVAALEPLGSSLDIVQAARDGAREIEDVGQVYFAVGDRLGLDWLRAQAEQIPPENHWERMALAAMIDDLFGQQRALTNEVLRTANGAVGEAAIDHWVEREGRAVARSRQLIADFRASGGLDIAKLAIANQYVGGMISR